MNIGRRIKECRTRLKMSAEELARRIGKDRSTVYRYESGDIDKVSVDMLEPLALALDTTPAYLMGIDQSVEFSAAHVEADGVTATFMSTNGAQVRHMEQWVSELGSIQFTDEENAEIICFAKYLLYKRMAGK